MVVEIVAVDGGDGADFLCVIADFEAFFGLAGDDDADLVAGDVDARHVDVVVIAPVLLIIDARRDVAPVGARRRRNEHENEENSANRGHGAEQVQSLCHLVAPSMQKKQRHAHADAPRVSPHTLQQMEAP